MKHNKFKVGDLAIPISDECGNFNDTIDAHHIKITSIDNDGDYYYDILSKDGKKLNSCFVCLDDKHLKLYIQFGLKDLKTGMILVFESGDFVTVLLDRTAEQGGFLISLMLTDESRINHRFFHQ